MELTDETADDLGPAWSPNGAEILFRSRRTGTGDIYVMKSDGSKETRLTLRSVTR
jgi:TolB protein